MGAPVPIGCAAANLGFVARLGLTVDMVARVIVAVMKLAKVKILTMMKTRILMVVQTNERMIYDEPCTCRCCEKE